MFARQAFRPARTLTNSVRRYATEAPKQSSNAALYGALGIVAAGAGYWYLNSSKGAAPALAASKPAEKTFKGGDQGFVSLVLEDVEVLSHNTKRFRFKLPAEDHVSGLNVASALLTKYKGPEMEKAVLRPYTPVNDEDSRGYLDLIVKKYPNGPMSSHLHDMAPGQSLDFKGPLPKFQWAPNKHEHIALIAGGTGITPMYQLIRAIVKNPEDRTKITLVYGNVGEDDILLKKELQELENTYPQRFRAFYLLDNPPAGWTQGKGRVTKEVLKTVLPEPKEGEKLKIFVCGPPGMYNAISGNKVSPRDQGELSGILKELGYDKEQVYKF
ncbi:Oxidoreductase FAD/NAD(P)-binding protein [Lasiodiplodia theobromae]|uniref:NADH-cytochrome b5 reductase n=1 Tax=Lasiodiplodia theobromae TaxID=45133 RepID=A0A5N5DSI1_9PEZI|nr:NADH-cytochrome b5 reductase [Lasiodiplodia theobromae]KAB2580979.1 NADH-cytochrome b5 reductase 2 [Lasiodiplodia theobromae]KAF4542320.1 NADH-cytochrome b5 reductase [Lasiodiplodia theobromae]KAF9635783.1 Oxidoreductase FAD/NAD(P)-binding protein [Lasiodiplodia theobromae]